MSRNSGEEPVMMDWLSQGDRSIDPNWAADWHRGTAIGLLVNVVLALAIGIVSVHLGSSGAPVASPLTPWTTP
jgi:hypothetical protein